MKLLSSDIGIIGGADGPTAVFVSTSPDAWIYAVAAVVIVAAVTAGIIFYRKKKK